MQPAPDLVTRFRHDFDALTGADALPLAVAVSGGPDSLALLLLAAAAFPGRVHAATVDHGLRPDNAGEARFVASVCAALDVPHAILAVPADAPVEGASLQARARAARYLLLGTWAEGQGCQWLATAHHLDDQAETVLMRLNRGAGPGGLGGIRKARPLTDGVTLVRPLLGWRRAELAAIVEDAGLEAVDDPSNRSPDYDRTHARRLLGESALLDPARLAASASHFAEAEAALEWAVEREWTARHSAGHGALLLRVDGLPPELLRRLAARAIDRVGARQWRTDKLPRLIEVVRAGGSATLGGTKVSGGTSWRFERAPPRRPVTYSQGRR